jgi:GDP-L-fucose synthase
MNCMNKTDTIYVAGAQTLIGLALYRILKKQGYLNVIGDDEPDLTDAQAVDAYFKENQPEYVFVAAGKSGGIEANRQYPANLMLDNLLVACHVIDCAYRHGSKKLLYLGSSCSYPKHSAQPMSVESLMTGSLEPTNEAYALAKLAGIYLCQAYRKQHDMDFIVGIPGNAFGPGDDFDLENAHVIPGMIHRICEAKKTKAPSVVIWGTGRPRREFVFVDDLADACIFVMARYTGEEPINIGSGLDLSVAELAECVKEIIGYDGEIEYDSNRPDGMPLKALDSRMLSNMGWHPQTSFRDALCSTYKWFLDQGVA